ncbi:MAG: hypothetical protein AB2L14_36875 [Candidatus Xenobiia bacterium LiM19]
MSGSDFKATIIITKTYVKVDEKFSSKVQVVGGIAPYSYEWFADGKRQENMTNCDSV